MLMLSVPKNTIPELEMVIKKPHRLIWLRCRWSVG